MRTSACSGSGCSAGGLRRGKEPPKLPLPRTRGRVGALWAICWARRLVEARRAAGARELAAWRRQRPRRSDNPMWDTHAQNSDRTSRTSSARSSTSGFTALIEDLDDRGLLRRDPGRRDQRVRPHPQDPTPKAGATTGATSSVSPWPERASAAQVPRLPSDAHGAYPTRAKVKPQELTATIFHSLGIGHDAFFPRRHRSPPPRHRGRAARDAPGQLSRATPSPAGPGGSPASVPEFSDALVVNTAPRTISRSASPIGGRGQLRGWQAEPIANLGGLRRPAPA